MPLTTGPFPIVLSYKRALSLTYSFQPAQKKKYAEATHSFIIEIYFYLRREINEMIRTSLSCVLWTTHWLYTNAGREPLFSFLLSLYKSSSNHRPLPRSILVTQYGFLFCTNCNSKYFGCNSARVKLINNCFYPWIEKIWNDSCNYYKGFEFRETKKWR